MEVGLQYHCHDQPHYLPGALTFSTGNRSRLSFQLHTQIWYLKDQRKGIILDLFLFVSLFLFFPTRTLTKTEGSLLPQKCPNSTGNK